MERYPEHGGPVDRPEVDDNRRDRITTPPWRKYSLSIEEAAEYFGIGEKRLYSLIHEHEDADFVLEIGSHIRIKRLLFEKYLDEVTTL